MGWALETRLAFLLVLLGSLASGVSAPAHARQLDLDHAGRPIALVLMSDQSPMPTLREMTAGIESSLQGEQVRVDVQYLDATRYSGTAQDRALAQWLTERYRGLPMRVIIGVGAAASTFAARFGREIWPTVPLMFAAVDAEWQQMTTRPDGTTVVGINLRYAETLEGALAIFPDTREVVLMAGSSPSDRRALRIARAALARFETRLAVTELSGLPIADLEARARELPDRSLLFPLVFFGDPSGQAVASAEVTGRLASLSRRPTITVHASAFGHGVIGGVLVDYFALGRLAGDQARRFMAGESPDALTVTDAGLASFKIDWRQAQRWGVADRIPATADVQFREAGLWARYRSVVEGVVGLIVIQAGVIGWLLLERRARRRAQQSLDDALGFERTFGQIAGLLALADPGSDRAMREAAERVARHFGVEHAGVYEPAGDDRLRAAAEYVAPGATAPPIEAAWARVPELATVLAYGGIWAGDTTAPQEGRQAATPTPITALMASPLRAAGHAGGALVVSGRQRPAWTPEHQRRLDAFGEIFANVLAHRRARVILHEHEAFNRAVLGAHGGEVGVLDASGAIVAVNEAWLQAAEGGEGLLAGARPGVAIVSALADSPQRPAHTTIAPAIASVLNGGPPLAVADVEWDGPQGRMWSEVRVRRLDRPDGGAVLSHIDITTRKRAELQVQQHLHEMAHLNMVSAVGELAASVAHELNQPLTAVLSNAQALRRLMNAPSSDPQLMREILEDIIAQDQRAGDVIQRMRRLLKKEKVDWQGIDLNELVRDVARMFQGEASLGGVPVTIDLAPSLPQVKGDRVQLQQVVLNLLQNATHAVRASAVRVGGRVLVSTTIDIDGVSVCVRDAGPGIAADLIDRVFDPFFTTKRQGLGLGLSISRSIVELHGGHILARNMPSGGAEFSFTIPVEVVTA